MGSPSNVLYEVSPSLFGQSNTLRRISLESAKAKHAPEKMLKSALLHPPFPTKESEAGREPPGRKDPQKCGGGRALPHRATVAKIRQTSTWECGNEHPPD